jgi:hypothetical protein
MVPLMSRVHLKTHSEFLWSMKVVIRQLNFLIQHRQFLSCARPTVVHAAVHFLNLGPGHPTKRQSKFLTRLTRVLMPARPARVLGNERASALSC